MLSNMYGQPLGRPLVLAGVAQPGFGLERRCVPRSGSRPSYSTSRASGVKRLSFRQAFVRKIVGLSHTQPTAIFPPHASWAASKTSGPSGA